MHFEIIIQNGHYPLTYKCTTMTEAYGCMETLRTDLLFDGAIDLEEVMESLVSMKHGKLLRVDRNRYSIAIQAGEV